MSNVYFFIILMLHTYRDDFNQKNTVFTTRPIIPHYIVLNPDSIFKQRINLLLWRYNSDKVFAFSTISFHLRRSSTCSAHLISFIFFRSFLTSSSYRDLGLPAGLPVNSFHLCILFTMLVSGILFMCPNQLSLWVLT